MHARVRTLPSRGQLEESVQFFPPDTLRAAFVQEFVQERAHFCSRSNKQTKFAIWAIYLGKLSEI